MFRLWGKLVKDGRIVADLTVEREDDTRTHRIFGAIEDMCHAWDLMNPIWLETTIRDFQNRAAARFYKESFIEPVDFDYMEIRVLEE